MILNLTAIWAFFVPFIKALLILIIGHIAVIYLLKITDKALIKANFDPSLNAFCRKALNIVLHALIILSALNSIGISTTGIIAALSAAGVAVALALKDSLGNVAGGILLLISPRFATGDYIEAGGNDGTVLGVDLLHTTILTTDNRRISIPNGVLINNHITNYSHEQKRRVDITFSIAYEANIEKAKSLILDAINSHPLVICEPAEPMARVISYGESSVNIITRSWCNNADYWTVFFDLTEQIRAKLEENNITIPYNQLDVHIKNN